MQRQRHSSKRPNGNGPEKSIRENKRICHGITIFEVVALRINACESGSLNFSYVQLGIFVVDMFFSIRRALLWQLALELPETQIASWFVWGGTTLVLDDEIVPLLHKVGKSWRAGRWDLLLRSNRSLGGKNGFPTRIIWNILNKNMQRLTFSTPVVVLLHLFTVSMWYWWCWNKCKWYAAKPCNRVSMTSSRP